MATSCLLFLTLLLCGGYAGMVLMCQIGVLPAMRDLDARSFAAAWRAMDAYMNKSMPPFKGALLLVTLATAVLLFVGYRPWLASACIVSLLFSLAGLVMTIRGQLPLNAELKDKALSEARIVAIRAKTSTGFSVRFVLAALSFVSLCIGVSFWPMF